MGQAGGATLSATSTQSVRGDDVPGTLVCVVAGAVAAFILVAQHAAVCGVVGVVGVCCG